LSPTLILVSASDERTHLMSGALHTVLLNLS
jgi:hypothetical protein